jgi:ABC-type nitrate/sulfonate/bicarbonate transport system substrate-binding protein
MTQPLQAIEKLWYTRCNVPTATGIALAKGWFADRFAKDGIELGVLQDAPVEISRHHYDHALPGLFREGGSVPAIVTRSDGQKTRLIGLTWVDERQVIVVAPDAGISDPEQLLGRRVVVPGWAREKNASHARAMALAGFEAALKIADLTLSDVTLIEPPVGKTVPPGKLRGELGGTQWPGLNLLVDGLADAAYVKGAAAVGLARAAGLKVLVDLDSTTAPHGRVNNGTPRPITVHDALLQRRPEWVIDFLALTLKASRWAASNGAEVRTLIGRETQASDAGDLDDAYGSNFHELLTPSLSAERLFLLDLQIDFLRRQHFIDETFSADDWADFEVYRKAENRSFAI